MQSVSLYAFAIVWSIITLVPLIFVLISSVKRNEDIFYEKMFRLPSVLKFDNYAAAMTKANMGNALFNSLFITSVSTLLLIIIASMAAFVLSRYAFKWNNLVYFYFIIGFMIPIHSTIVPLLRLVSSFNGQNSYVTMILLYVSFQLSISIFMITGFMREISKEIDEAAKIDGCGPVRLLFQIIMPLSAPILSTTAIVVFLYIYNDLIFSVIFLSKEEMYTITLAMMAFVGRQSVEYGPIFACIIISIIPLLTIYLLLQEKVIGGLSAGAVKG